jgi:FtsP/CotA-like multicopper oxidase with cupredoxin domain
MLDLLSSALLLVTSLAATAGPIQINDNQRAAGRLDGSVLTLDLFADLGSWRPEGSQGASVEVAAFGEEGAALSVPGPLIRAREGTTAALTLRNALGSDLHVHGLCSRPGPCDVVSVPAGASREIRVALNAPGTYYYWGSTSGRTLTARPAREMQLGGAIVVDPREGAAPDRVFVISIFDEPRPPGPCIRRGEHAIFAINGMSWPHTETLHYEVGDSVRWRVINLSCDMHAMHLHGFHFKLESAGDGVVDRQLAPDQQRTEVTEPIVSGRTFTMTWTPTRAGNWLFHCHMVGHMAAPRAKAQMSHGAVDHAAGMAGLVLGVEVTGADTVRPPTDRAPRRFSLVLREEPNRYGSRSGFRMDLEGTAAPRLDPGPVPGPVMVLQRGEPAEITIVNRMTEPTAIHWHGIELESYFDGVPGFGGKAGRLAPVVAPGQSFVAELTPPRAGTFIYHTHWHDEAQLAGGLYGALIVLEPGEQYDPATDHVIVIGLNGVLVSGQREPFALNGRATPEPIRMRGGVPNRLRLINITANNVALTAFLVDRFEVTQWKPVAKDGATLPPEQAAPRLARQLVSVGETYDFEVRPTRPQNLWLEVRRANGEWVLQAPVEIR